jgi:CDP-glucose 4,6-dehydratase
VLDPVYGYLLTASKLYRYPQQFSGSWNFGPDPESIRTVRELVEGIVLAWGSGLVSTGPNDADRHEATLLQLNCDKARQILGWTPRWNFDSAVSHTVSWYKDVAEGKSALELSRSQIMDFTNGYSA